MISNQWIALALFVAVTGCASSKAPSPAPPPAVARVDTVVRIDTVRKVDTVERPAAAQAREFSFKVAPRALSLAARRGGGQPLSDLPDVQDKQALDDESFGNCGADGSNSSGGPPLDAVLNEHKNRIDEPSDGKYYFVEHSAITKLTWPDPIPKNRPKWTQEDRDEIAKYEGLPVQVEGYLASEPPYGAKQEGAESPNCYSTDPNGVDYHIWLNAERGNDRSSAIVVEMTPRIRTAKHEGAWTLAKLHRASKESRRVRVSGWLMFDQEHPEQLQKTRTTLWEIHPILDFEVETDANGEFVPLDDWNPSSR